MTRLFPGDRRVWLVAVVLLIAFAGLTLYQVLAPRDYFTGTNNVRSRSVVAVLHQGDRLCIPRLDIPGGTGQVEFDLPGDRLPALELKLRVGAVVVRGSRPLQEGPRNRKVGIAVPLVSTDGESAAGSVCVNVRGRGEAVVGGMFGLQPGEPSPTVNGRALNARVSVWFRPPIGERRSIASLWPDIARRASLFRPGAVGPWTYWLLLLVIAPGVAILAVRTLALAAGSETTPIRIAVQVGAATFLSAACWSLITPVFDAPDEPDHFAYTQYLAETGNAPCQTCRREEHSTDERLALAGIRLYSRIEAGDGRPPWLELDEQRWREYVTRAGGPPRNDGGGPTTAATHTPLYYSLLVPAYGAARSQSIFSRLHLMRLISALLGALTAACVALAVAELLPRQAFAATAAGLLAGFEPMFGFIAGAVNNDAGVNLASALSILVVIRILRGGLSVRLALALGVLMVLLPLMKVTGYGVYPAALAAIAVVAWREVPWRNPMPWAALVGSFGVLQAVWKSVSPSFDRTAFATPGGGVPGSQGPVADALNDLPGFASYLWQIFLPRIPPMADLHPQSWPAFDIYVERGFAAFGWYAFTFPGWVYGVIVGVMLATAVLAGTTLWRERQALSRIKLELILLCLVVIAVIGGVEASYFTQSGDRHAVAEQGRYAFTALLPLTVISIGACFAFGRQRAVWLTSALTIAMIGLNYASQLMLISKAYS